MANDRGFMLFPDGRIEEVDADGLTFDHQSEPGLFDDLVYAGYPLHSDTTLPRWDGVIDVTVFGDAVTCHTGKPNGVIHMGPAGELFLGWLRSVDAA
jgi:hypothetical protein